MSDHDDENSPLRASLERSIAHKSVMLWVAGAMMVFWVGVFIWSLAR